MTREPDTTRTCRLAGFSLVELLVVVAVIALLMSLSGVALNSLGGSASLAPAGQLLEAGIALAAQQASARNEPVQLRIYKDLDPPRVATVSLADPSAPVFLGKVLSLPDAVVFEGGSTYSNLLGAGVANGTESNSAPGAVRGAAWRGFTIQPDGRTDLALASAPWSLTLKARNAPSAGTLPAANFVTLVIDPVTSAVRMFQP